VQRATAQSKTGDFRGFGVAEAPPSFQAGLSDCMFCSLSFCSFCLLILNATSKRQRTLMSTKTFTENPDERARWA
jgi:hypothetical protein